MNLQDVLRCSMDASAGAGAATVGEYFGHLLATLWSEGEGFSAKRPFGNSGWQYDVYIALARAGLIDGLMLDENGYVDEFSPEAQRAADDLIVAAIRVLGAP